MNRSTRPIRRADLAVSVVLILLSAGYTLAQFARAQETANRVKCASNERQIGQAMLLYANDNRGKYAPDLGTLLMTQDITIDVFVCPSSSNEVPADVLSAPKAKQAAWINDNSSYVYLGAG